MNDDRKEKLEKLKSATKQGAKTNVNMLVDLETVFDSLDKSVAEFKDVLGLGIDINKLDEFMEQLASVSALKPMIRELKEAIEDVPTEVKIDNIDDLVKAVKDIQIKAPDVIVPRQKQLDYSKGFIKIIDQLNNLTKAIKANAPVVSQEAKDYVPQRRVIKVGNTFQFDDNAGGSGGIPTTAGGYTGPSIPTMTDTDGTISVPVVNPDGSYISGSSSGSSVASSLVNNQQTATTSAVALPSNTLTQGITIEALSTNTVSVFVGGAGVTTSNGLELPAGSAVTLPVNNSNLVYIRCASASPVVSFIGA